MFYNSQLFATLTTSLASSYKMTGEPLFRIRLQSILGSEYIRNFAKH